MAYKYLILLAFVSVCCQRNTVQFGEYDVTPNVINYSLELYKDSSFRYIKRYEWPIDVSLGKWHVDGNRLILNSVPDTFRYRNLTTNTYIMLKDKYLRIKHHKIIDDSSHLTYRLDKQKRDKFSNWVATQLLQISVAMISVGMNYGGLFIS
jgi:hypothetical protein